MPPAFSHFEEPYAWLIRGLIEYGWPDISRPGTRIPEACIGGLQLADLVRTGGAQGLLLEIPARSGGQICLEDGQYQFRACLTRDTGRAIFVLRCPEANYFQEFEFDPANPIWAAGYMHQALTEYIPTYVNWRLQGGEISWAERAGIPNVEAEPASQLLVGFTRERVNRNLVFDLGPSEDWWPLSSGAGQGDHWQGGPIARVGSGGGEPVFRRRDGKVQVLSSEEQRVIREATRLLDLPGTVLVWLSATHILGGTIWFANGIYSWLAEDELGDVGFALKISFFLATLSYSLGTAALLGGRRYKRIHDHNLVMISITFIGIMPLLYLWISLWMSWWLAMTIPIWIGGGVVVSVWAWRTWNEPLVQKARALENRSG